MNRQCWIISILSLLYLMLMGCSSSYVQMDGDKERRKLAATYNVELGIAYMQKGNVERAKKKLLQALDQAPDDSLTHYSLAYFYEHTGERQKAEESYRKAINVQPDSGQAHNNYGAFLCRQGRYEAAEEEFMRAVAIKGYTQTGQAYENAGLCALDAHRVEAAEKYFRIGIQHNPGLSDALLELADINYHKSKLKQAQNYLDRYKVSHRPIPRTLLLGAKIARRLGDDDAYASYRLLLKNKYSDSKEYQLLQKIEKQDTTKQEK